MLRCNLVADGVHPLKRSHGATRLRSRCPWEARTQILWCAKPLTGFDIAKNGCEGV
jgi:hypothetical protein